LIGGRGRRGRGWCGGCQVLHEGRV
jgi:hypothetical protein